MPRNAPPYPVFNRIRPQGGFPGLSQLQHAGSPLSTSAAASQAAGGSPPAQQHIAMPAQMAAPPPAPINNLAQLFNLGANPAAIPTALGNDPMYQKYQKSSLRNPNSLAALFGL